LETQSPIKEPGNLSPRIEWLRNYYFRGLERPWNNEFTSWGTGEPWDVQYDETTFYIVPETYAFSVHSRLHSSRQLKRLSYMRISGRGVSLREDRGL